MLRFLPLVFVFLVSSACAKQAPEQTETVDKVAAAASKETIAAKLKEVRPDLTLENLRASPLEGFYEAQIAGGPEVFISDNGKYMFTGGVFEIADAGLVDIRELRFSAQRRQAVEDIAVEDTIAFAPVGETKAVAYVFTDVDCGFCRKLHQQMPAYNEAGIEIRYLAYPRAGVGSGSYQKIASAWCAADKQVAMTKLKQLEPIETNVCEGNPVADQYALGGQLGVRGTPAILLTDGRLLPGYMDAAALSAQLGI